ncbi:hypothetical protein AB0C21_21945 [Spirillospora sp. NPDC049024]
MSAVGGLSVSTAHTGHVLPGSYDQSHEDRDRSEDGVRERHLMASPTGKSTPQAKDRTTKKQQGKERPVRLSVNLSPEISEIFSQLVERKGLSITEGVRTAIKVWKFLEDEIAAGNQIAVIEPDKSVHKVYVI